MTTLVRSSTSVAWAVLVGLTVLSWALGAHGFGGDQVPVSVVIIAVAVFKVRLVGLYFMELRTAPWLLRGMFEGYCVLLLVLLSTMFLLGVAS
jgi:caa(3)-type oxidase subunit IV